MRILISAVGTRGDIQPAVALAVELRRLGQDVRLCVPPNFIDWVTGLGFEATPVGVEMRARRPAPTGAQAAKLARQPPATLPDLVRDQFDAVGAAAQSCSLIVGAGGHQYAAPSIAERHGVRYVNAVYAPVSLPSPDYPPPPGPGQTWESSDPNLNQRRWLEHAKGWNDRLLEQLNEHRHRLSLRAVDDVLEYLRTNQPWLAADPRLAPRPSTPGKEVVQTGAWLLSDPTPLPSDIDVFLNAGEPPIYLGFGSMPVANDTGRTLIDAARAVGRRAILSRGWAEFTAIDDASDCLTIDDVNHQALFPRVAAVVHHGGAGTTTAAARAGTSQVIAPMFSDQFYWAARIAALHVGVPLLGGPLTVQALTTALEAALRPELVQSAQAFAPSVITVGAVTAAKRLVEG